MSTPTKFVLDESKMPRHWYNIMADLPVPLAPPLHPGTLQPVGPDDLTPLFPLALIQQEVSTEREIEIQCDFHLWMHAYIFVMDHPFYAVSADDGTFAIEGLPPGDYTLEAWHEKLGRQRQAVKVTDKGLADVTFTYPR